MDIYVYFSDKGQCIRDGGDLGAVPSRGREREGRMVLCCQNPTSSENTPTQPLRQSGCLADTSHMDAFGFNAYRVVHRVHSVLLLLVLRPLPV